MCFVMKKFNSQLKIFFKGLRMNKETVPLVKFILVTTVGASVCKSMSHLNCC